MKEGKQMEPKPVKSEADEKFKDVGIERRGEKIILPENMSFKEGIKWLMRRQDEDEQEVGINEQFDAHPLEGALALAKSLMEKFGFSSLVPTPGFFGSTPPTLVSLEIGLNADGAVETVQVPWGRMKIPGIEGYLDTEMSLKDGRPVFVLGGVVRQKHKHIVKEIANLIRRFLREESIYRGKAFRADFPSLSDDPQPQLADFCPKFIDTSRINDKELVFADSVNRQITTSIFTPIEHTQACRQYKIPLKRGILLEGPYGVGKTLTAYVTAKKCVENGWTFIYLNSVSDLEQAIHFAKAYQPAVIFAEDLDQVLNGNDRDDKVNGILNTIDGVETKSAEIVVVLTTNNISNITQAMLRPGRLDAVISVRPPDAKAVANLIRLYARGLIADGQDLAAAGEVLKGKIPAVIREVVERSKLAAIGRLTGDEPLKLHTVDLVTAAEGMLNHLQLLQPKDEDERSDLEKLGSALGNAIGKVAHSEKKAVSRLLESRERATENGSSKHLIDDTQD